MTHRRYDAVASNSEEMRSAPIRVPLMRSRRWLFFGLVGLTTATGSWMMLGIIGAAGISAIEIAILALFIPTFGWITISFWNALIGFTLLMLKRDPLTLMSVAVSDPAGPAIRSRTALVMPAHNEDPVRVMDGLAATLESLACTGQDGCFDTFLLSDTTDPAMIESEELAWERLKKCVSGPERLTYRRRPKNTGRKSGNLADFCDRWGNSYEFLVVLDADSIMTGAALVELVRTMEANPEAGLLQTVPLPARQDTLFGRLLQFAACLYSPMLSTGQSFWQGDAANYWGHNAILRMNAFRKHCRLPVLSGRPPLGGEILSHDFVEAALLRRAGWGVYLASWIGGSFEEVPGNIPDYARRDRRWAQGSLQHLRLLGMRGLHPLSRGHFVMGAMGYLSSVLWLLMLIGSTAYVVFAEAGVATAFTRELLLLSTSASSIVRPIPSLLWVTVTLLFVPKGLGLVVAMVRQRSRFGGGVRLLVSGLLEGVFAVVIAPVLMVYHTRFVAGILGGHQVAWDGRTRGGSGVSWRLALRETVGCSLLGLAWGGLTLYSSLAFFLWLTPIFLGLMLAAPITRLTSSPTLGRRARSLGLFLTPFETSSLDIEGGRQALARAGMDRKPTGGPVSGATARRLRPRSRTKTARR